MARVGIRELKNNLGYYISLVRNGQEVTVTNRGREVARIVPVEEYKTYSKLTDMVREGKAAWEGGKPATPKPVKAKGKPASSIVLEDRR